MNRQIIEFSFALHEILIVTPCASKIDVILVLGIDAPADMAISDYPFPVIPAGEFAKLDPVKMYIQPILGDPS